MHTHTRRRIPPWTSQGVSDLQHQNPPLSDPPLSSISSFSTLSFSLSRRYSRQISSRPLSGIYRWFAMAEPTRNDAIAMAHTKEPPLALTADDILAEPTPEEPLVQETDDPLPLLLAQDTGLSLPGTGQPLPLTRKNLARLNTLNGNSKRKKDSAYFESDTMPISTTASEFQQQAYENGILDPTASRQPHDLGALRRHLTQRRRSIPPSGLAHQQFCEEISYSYNESEASDLVRTEIMVNYRHLDQRYGRSISRTITQIPQQDFNRNLSPPQPDLMEGLKASFLPLGLRTHALHSDRSLALCHFSPSSSGPTGTLPRPSTRRPTVVLSWPMHKTMPSRGLEPRRSRAREIVLLAPLWLPLTGRLGRRPSSPVRLTARSSRCSLTTLRGGSTTQCRVANESLLAYPNRGRELLRNAQDYARHKSYELAALLGANL